MPCPSEAPIIPYGKLSEIMTWPIAFLVLTFPALPMMAQAEEPKASASRPNVLFISMDDLNDWIGCLGGHPQTRTPNLDRLAKSGVLFRNAHCAAPSCNPSRSAIFSGLPPHRSGLYQNLQKLREVLPKAELLPRYFSNQGYWSAGSGKMLHYVIDPPSWDDYFPDKAKDDPFPPTFHPKNRPVSLPRGGTWQYGETDWAALDVTDEEFGGDWLVTKWIGEQLQRPHEKPFFLACGLYRPHEPWFVPKKYFEPFPLETLQHGPGVKEGDLDDVPAEGQRIARNRYFPHILEHKQWEKGIQAYLASIHFADAMLGRVLDALERSPNRDNTIVVLWSDHGWHLGEKEHWQKFTPWRASSRVPLIIRVPKGAPGLAGGTLPGGTCDRPVSLTDLFGTLTDLCGLPAKAGIESRSLVPLLRDPASPWPHAAITHLDHPGNFAISTERWRYIHYRDGGEELYDIENDPHEWTNLASKPEHLVKLVELRALAPRQIAPIHETQPGINDFKADLEVAPITVGAAPASKASDAPVTLLFLNKRQKSVRLVWLDESGKQHDRIGVPGASRWLVHTFAGHTWMLLDEDGKALGHLITPEKNSRVLIQ
jgi:arylsulfatase A-like enzyme